MNLFILLNQRLGGSYVSSVGTEGDVFDTQLEGDASAKRA